MTFNMNSKWNARWCWEIQKIDGFTVYKVPGLNWLLIEHSFRNTQGINLIPARFWHVAKKYDLLHFHELELSFPAFSLFVKKPKILHLHGFNPDILERNVIGKTIFKRVADLYIAITKQMEEDLIKVGIPENKITYLPNAINTNFFRPVKNKQSNLVLFIGRITYGKGVHILIRALNYLRTPICLVIIGPMDNDHDYCQKLLNVIQKENSKNKHKIMYLGPLDQKDILKWYQRASILILPSFWEAFPVVILEALACETAVIATSVGGVQDIIKNKETGILVKPGNSFQLANTIQYLLDNDDIRRKIASKGREQVINQYSLEVVSRKLCDIYSQLLKSS